MHRMVSLDTSTKVSGMALFENGILTSHHVIDLSKNRDSEDRMNKMGEALLIKLREWKPDSIWLEHPQGEGRNVLVVSKLSEIIGIVRAYAISKKCDFHEINPSEWRKYIFNQGKMKRDELKLASIESVKKRYNIDCECDDLADAINIGTAVIEYFNSTIV